MTYIPLNPFDFNFESTCYAISNYAIVGKSLTFATKFEKDAKGLANFLKLRHSHLILNKDRLSEFIDEIEKFQVMRKTIDILKIDKVNKELFENAIEARNFIAHDLTIGLEYTVEDKSAREMLIELLKNQIQKIAEAEKLLLLLNCYVNKEPFPNAEYLDSYTEKIVKWVTDTET